MSRWILLTASMYNRPCMLGNSGLEAQKLARHLPKDAGQPLNRPEIARPPTERDFNLVRVLKSVVIYSTPTESTVVTGAFIGMPPASALLHCTLIQRPFQRQGSSKGPKRPVAATRCTAESGTEQIVAGRRAALQVCAHHTHSIPGAKQARPSF